MAQNNSNKFTDYVPPISSLTSTGGKITYVEALHTDNLVYPLYILGNAPGAIENRKPRQYFGFYYKTNTGQYFTGKNPQTKASSDSKLDSSINRSTPLTNRNPSGLNTGYYFYLDYSTDPNSKVIYSKPNLELTFENNENITTSVYNGETGKSTPSHINYIMGNMVRFFVRQRGTQNYGEIDSRQYDSIPDGDPIWDKRRITWVVSGGIYEYALMHNKTQIWLTECGGLPQTTISSSPSSTSPTSYISPLKKTFTYTGPSTVWSDGGDHIFSYNPQDNFEKLELFTNGLTVAKERGKNYFTHPLLPFSTQGNGWEGFFKWYENNYGGYNSSHYFYFYKIFSTTPTSDPYSCNQFSNSCFFEPRDLNKDISPYLKYFIQTPDSDVTPECNAIDKNGDIISSQFYDKNSPLFKSKSDINKRVDLKNGTTYPPLENILYKKPIGYSIYNSLYISSPWSGIASYHFNKFKSTDSFTTKEGNDLIIPDEYQTPYSTNYLDAIPKFSEKSWAIYAKKTTKPPTGGSTSTTSSFEDKILTDNGKGNPIFKMMNNKPVMRGFACSIYSIYQYTGQTNPFGGNYDTIYYRIPENLKDTNISYSGHIFQTFKDCEASAYHGTTIFKGLYPPDLKSVSNKVDYSITSNSVTPLYTRDEIKNKIKAKFGSDAKEYLDKVGIT